MQCLSDARTWHAPEIERPWRARLSASHAPHASYQSPEWVDHHARVCEGDRRVVVVTLGEDGVVPVLVETRELDFAVSRLCLLARPLRSAVILGGAPLVSDEAREAA